MIFSEKDSFVDCVKNTYRRKSCLKKILHLQSNKTLLSRLKQQRRMHRNFNLIKNDPSANRNVHKLYVNNLCDEYGGTSGKFALKGGKPCFQCNGDHILQRCYYRQF